MTLTPWNYQYIQIHVQSAAIPLTTPIFDDGNTVIVEYRGNPFHVHVAAAQKELVAVTDWQMKVFKNTVKQKVLNLITYMSYLTCITLIKLDYPCSRKIKHTLLLENLYGRLPNIFSRMWSVCRQHKVQYNMIGNMCIT